MNNVHFSTHFSSSTETADSVLRYDFDMVEKYYVVCLLCSCVSREKTIAKITKQNKWIVLCGARSLFRLLWTESHQLQIIVAVTAVAVINDDFSSFFVQFFVDVIYVCLSITHRHLWRLFCLPLDRVHSVHCARVDFYSIFDSDEVWRNRDWHVIAKAFQIGIISICTRI